MHETTISTTQHDFTIAANLLMAATAKLDDQDGSEFCKVVL
jgi:hypothetical protein